MTNDQGWTYRVFPEVQRDGTRRDDLVRVNARKGVRILHLERVPVEHAHAVDFEAAWHRRPYLPNGVAP